MSDDPSANGDGDGNANAGGDEDNGANDALEAVWKAVGKHAKLPSKYSRASRAFSIWDLMNPPEQSLNHMLTWLLNSAGSHGLGDLFWIEFARLVETEARLQGIQPWNNQGEASNEIPKPGNDEERTAASEIQLTGKDRKGRLDVGMGFRSDGPVWRLDPGQIVVAIELKTDSEDGQKQLDGYKEALEAAVCGVFVTRDGTPPKHAKLGEWVLVAWPQVGRALAQAIATAEDDHLAVAPEVTFARAAMANGSSYSSAEIHALLDLSRALFDLREACGFDGHGAPKVGGNVALWIREFAQIVEKRDAWVGAVTGDQREPLITHSNGDVITCRGSARFKDTEQRERLFTVPSSDNLYEFDYWPEVDWTPAEGCHRPHNSSPIVVDWYRSDEFNPVVDGMRLGEFCQALRRLRGLLCVEGDQSSDTRVSTKGALRRHLDAQVAQGLDYPRIRPFESNKDLDIKAILMNPVELWPVIDYGPGGNDRWLPVLPPTKQGSEDGWDRLRRWADDVIGHVVSMWMVQLEILRQAAR